MNFLELLHKEVRSQKAYFGPLRVMLQSQDRHEWYARTRLARFGQCFLPDPATDLQALGRNFRLR